MICVKLWVRRCWNLFINRSIFKFRAFPWRIFQIRAFPWALVFAIVANSTYILLLSTTNSCRFVRKTSTERSWRSVPLSLMTLLNDSSALLCFGFPGPNLDSCQLPLVSPVYSFSHTSMIAFSRDLRAGEKKHPFLASLFPRIAFIRAHAVRDARRRGGKIRAAKEGKESRMIPARLSTRVEEENNTLDTFLPTTLDGRKIREKVRAPRDRGQKSFIVDNVSYRHLRMNLRIMSSARPLPSVVMLINFRSACIPGQFLSKSLNRPFFL